MPAADALALLHALHEADELVDAADLTRTAAHRATASAVVAGTGPIAVGVVVGLVVAGVGAVYVETKGVAGGGDLGTGLIDVDRGRPRLDAVRAAVSRRVPAASVGPPPRTLLPDLVVLADEVPEPAKIAELMGTGTAHLAARMRDGVGVVGPLVLPRRSACLGCLDLQRSAFDPGWPVVAAQLVGRRGGAEPVCVTATAAIATAQALAALDATTGAAVPPPTLDATLEVDPAAATVVRRHWSAVPECWCGAADGRIDHVPTDLSRAPALRGVTIEG